MKRFAFQILSSIVLIGALGLTAAAQQPSASRLAQPQVQAPQRGRGVEQQQLRDAAKAEKQAAQPPRNLAADQPKRNEQQLKNKRAQTIVDTYIGGFQSNVGLSAEQTRKYSNFLGDYVRRQLM